MPRGGKRKSIEEHIENGTVRQDRHGIKPNKSDNEKLDKMKDTLFDVFNKTKAKLENTDIDKNPDTYKQLNQAMLEQVKTFFTITKYSGLKDGETKPSGKINIKDYQQ